MALVDIYASYKRYNGEFYDNKDYILQDNVESTETFIPNIGDTVSFKDNSGEVHANVQWRVFEYYKGNLVVRLGLGEV